jgi:phosphatidylglycerophosphate synthase
MTISNDSRARIKQVFEPIALAMGRVGLTPDGLTLIGFGITVVGAILLAAQLWLIGGIVVFIGGVFDMFDGTLARATGKVSPLGAFMDSVFDRWGEAIVYLGIVIGSLGFLGDPTSEVRFPFGAVLAAAAMGSAFMVSYARAKSVGLGFTSGTGMAAVGIMPREVRLIVLSLGLILAGVSIAGDVSFPNTDLVQLGDTIQLDLEAGHGFIALALGVILVGSPITVIQRILHVRAQAKQDPSTTTTSTTNDPRF